MNNRVDNLLCHHKLVSVRIDWFGLGFVYSKSVVNKMIAGHCVSGGAGTRDKKIPADFRADSLSHYATNAPFKVKTKTQKTSASFQHGFVQLSLIPVPSYSEAYTVSHVLLSSDQPASHNSSEAVKIGPEVGTRRNRKL
ncbi:hypothetical protein PoB_003650500 [Plakobranchus ocellatus]|uniref:Uncharacterized protein n=1 Tax=Plakobranchus ocellatus TaxID=259542 RepID=A0AAV4AP13_9GAST|nr:hypothetical protein PoB_003650500 [Plakobranchus ocellatus]